MDLLGNGTARTKTSAEVSRDFVIIRCSSVWLRKTRYLRAWFAVQEHLVQRLKGKRRTVLVRLAVRVRGPWNFTQSR